MPSDPEQPPRSPGDEPGRAHGGGQGRGGHARWALPPGWRTRPPERLDHAAFEGFELGGPGRDGPVQLAALGPERWVLKPADAGSAANEVIASVVGRSLGLRVPPAGVVGHGGGLLAASLLVPWLRHDPRVGFNDRNPLRFGPSGPADIPNYWPQVGLGRLLGDIDRKGGNWGLDQHGQRWDFDFSLSEGAAKFVAPDTPGWHRQRVLDLRQGVEAMRARGLTPAALEGFLVPYRTLAQAEPEDLFGWLGGVGDLGVLRLDGRSLKEALIEAGHANRRAAREALGGLGLL